jgi:hypothetical protein
MSETGDKKIQTFHAKQRMSERFGRSFGDEDMKRLAGVCNNGDFLCFFEEQGESRVRVMVEFDGHYYPVIYDKSTNSVVTVLSFSMLNREESALFVDALLKRGKTQYAIS